MPAALGSGPRGRPERQILVAMALGIGGADPAPITFAPSRRDGVPSNAGCRARRQQLRRCGPQARVMVAPGCRAAHASAAASRAAVQAVGRPACQAAQVPLTRRSARPRPALLAAITPSRPRGAVYAWIERCRRPRLFRRIRRRDRADARWPRSRCRAGGVEGPTPDANQRCATCLSSPPKAESPAYARPSETSPPQTPTVRR